MEFLSRYKKIFIIIGFLSIAFFSGYILYIAFFKTGPANNQPVGNQEQLPGANKLPGAKEGSGLGTSTTTSGKIGGSEAGLENKITEPITTNRLDSLNQVKEVTQTEAYGATLSANKSGLQYYNKEDGKFYRISNDGRPTPLSDKIFHDVKNIVWSPKKNKAVLEYPDGANTIYDFDSNKQITLPSHWQDFDFSPDGGQLVMKSISLDSRNNWLAIANEDGSKAQKIENLGDNADKVISSWSPNNQTIAMYTGIGYTEGENFNRQEVFFVGKNGENFKSMTVEGRGFQSKWSPEGNQLVYSVYSSDTDLKPMLWVSNAKGDSINTGRKKLDVETWADKCSYSDSFNLYCAVPDKLEEGAGLFPEMAQHTSDKLYAIDIRTGAKKLISTPDGSYNISNIMIADSGKTLYFTDANTKKLYNINLK